MGILFATFLLLHGVAHLVGFLSAGGVETPPLQF
jgi:hypothetical protein